MAGLVAIAFSGLVATGCDGTATTSAPPAPSASSARLSPPIAVSSDYRTAVERQVAVRLHLSPERVRSQLRADPNATVMTLAKPAGLAQDQLASIVLTALRDSGDAAVGSGSWSAQQAEEENGYWASQSQGRLIAEVSVWFRQG
jgi:hypothetical protein